MADRLAALRASIDTLKDQIARIRRVKADETLLGSMGKDSTVNFQFSIRRQLRGHFGKLYALDWAKQPQTLLSASQDGKLILWNAFTETKKDAISLKSAWVMACAFEKTEDRHVACGGLDNICTIYDLTNPVVPANELIGHDGYLAACKFIGRTRVLTSSGDSSAALWDAERATRIQSFKDHSADVMSLSINPSDPNMFASGSCDSKVMIWDIRTGAAVRTFTGHTSDVNAVEFFPSGNAVASGSDDASCRIFDLRACACMRVYTSNNITCGVTDVTFSSTGRLLFASYDNNFCLAWETIAKDDAFHELRGHKSRISCVGVNSTGQALATGSWDSELAIWA